MLTEGKVGHEFKVDMSDLEGDPTYGIDKAMKKMEKIGFPTDTLARIRSTLTNIASGSTAGVRGNDRSRAMYSLVIDDPNDPNSLRVYHWEGVKDFYRE